MFPCRESKMKGQRPSCNWAHVVALVLFVAVECQAQSTPLIRVDASQPFEEPAPARYTGDPQNRRQVVFSTSTAAILRWRESPGSR